MKKMIQTRKNKFTFKSFCILLALFLAGGLIFSFSFWDKEKALAAPNSTLYFNPASKTVAMNQDFTLDVMIDPGTNQVNGVGLRVTFDPAKFRLNSVSNAGGALSEALPGSAVDNNAGTASADFAIAPGGTPVTTASKIATLSLHSLSAVSNSSVSFTSGAYAVAAGETVDVITTRNAAAVTVTGVTYGDADFANLASQWLQTGSADLNSDGIVNTRDLGIMMSNWQ